MKKKPIYSVVLTTASSLKEARQIVHGLLKKKLIACGNIVSSTESHFIWKGKVCVEKETLIVLKTKEKVFEKLKDEILDLHSYEVPEIIMLRIQEGFEKYLQWIDEGVE